MLPHRAINGTVHDKVTANGLLYVQRTGTGRVPVPVGISWKQAVLPPKCDNVYVFHFFKTCTDPYYEYQYLNRAGSP